MNLMNLYFVLYPRCDFHLAFYAIPLLGWLNTLFKSRVVNSDFMLFLS